MSRMCVFSLFILALVLFQSQASSNPCLNWPFLGPAEKVTTAL
jgi:hypothetical protein